MDFLSILISYKLLLPPFVGAVIGWTTNYVAIKLLFRPHRPVEVFGYRFQGLIPKRRKEIARSIARAIEKELLSSEDIAGVLTNIEWKKEVEQVLEDLVEHRLSSEKLRKLPIVGLVSDNLTYHLKYLLTKEILKQIDLKKDSIVAKFRKNVDVREMLFSKIDKLDVVRFEGLLTEFIARELKHLEYLGGVMGFIIGVFQSGIFYFIG
jgi:uncharacterized membrane protein YheB (UPF0754 family)